MITVYYINYSIMYSIIFNFILVLLQYYTVHYNYLIMTTIVKINKIYSICTVYICHAVFMSFHTMNIIMYYYNSV